MPDDPDFDDTLLTLAARPDRRRQVAFLYPVRYVSRFRLSDVDAYGHVNNVAMQTLHEDARASLLERVWPSRARDGLQMIAAQHVAHFLAEGAYPGEVECCGGVGGSGATSFVVVTALFAGGVCLSLGDTVMLARRSGAFGLLSDDDRTALRRWRLAPGG